MRLILILSIVLAIVAPNAYAAQSKGKPAKVSQAHAKRAAKQLKRQSKAQLHAQREAKRKALAKRQVANARRIASERKKKDEEANRQLTVVAVTNKITPQPAIEVTHQKGDILQIDDSTNFNEFDEFNDGESF